MPTLVLLRHGQSQWNLENRFTGWWDVDLSDRGIVEARAAGALLRDKGMAFDCCFTSVQTRAIRTLHLVLHELESLWLPVTKDWHLNERHYGGLTGLNKAETIAKVGEEQVRIWRRSFDIPPPPLDADSPYRVRNDRRYAGIDIPHSESLKDTIARVLPYYEAAIVPRLRASGGTTDFPRKSYAATSPGGPRRRLSPGTSPGRRGRAPRTGCRRARPGSCRSPPTRASAAR